MADHAYNVRVGANVKVSRVYTKRPMYRSGQWRFAGFYPQADEPREDCNAVGKLACTEDDGPVVVVMFILPGSHEQTALFVHIDDIEYVINEPYIAPEINCFWVGGKFDELNGLADYVRELEQRIIAIENALAPIPKDDKAISFEHYGVSNV